MCIESSILRVFCLFFCIAQIATKCETSHDTVLLFIHMYAGLLSTFIVESSIWCWVTISSIEFLLFVENKEEEEGNGNKIESHQSITAPWIVHLAHTHISKTIIDFLCAHHVCLLIINCMTRSFENSLLLLQCHIHYF